MTRNLKWLGRRSMTLGAALLAAGAFAPCAGSAAGLDQAPVTSAPPRPHPAFGSAPDWPAPGHDSGSIAGVVSAFYEAISAAPGQHLDRHRLRSLFTPDGRIAFAVPAGKSGGSDVVYLTPDQYADGYEMKPDAQHPAEGFYDKVLANQIVQFGDIAHVWASYESRKNPNDKTPFARGIKSFELVRHGGNWYILQLFYDRESKDNPLPLRFLKDRTF